MCCNRRRQRRGEALRRLPRRGINGRQVVEVQFNHHIPSPSSHRPPPDSPRTTQRTHGHRKRREWGAGRAREDPGKREIPKLGGAAATCHFTPGPPGWTPSSLTASAATVVACHVTTAATSSPLPSPPAALPNDSTTHFHHPSPSRGTDRYVHTADLSCATAVLGATSLAPTLTTVLSSDMAGTMTASRHGYNGRSTTSAHKMSQNKGDDDEVTQGQQDPACMSDETARTTHVSERNSSEYDDDAHNGVKHDAYGYDMRRQVARARRVSEAAAACRARKDPKV
ncbi:hypothetical protein BDN70DRAFT_902282 [Pholiota conissans]|uniref:Uncharacterized protein n=1 Tax=Pholiota conissans TaxID=109636 RepID=A0A9P5YJ29_9AGAR|nr:hypothetical protein BDN70DRAFT_902282 [Pholiota conissans]